MAADSTSADPVTAAPILLVDGRNNLYRAVYSAKHDQRGHHPLVIFFRHISDWIRLYKPQAVHLFWDAPRDSVWRRDYLASYKNRDDSDYVAEISASLNQSQVAAQALLQMMGVRQFSRKRMEADDLIYAAATVLHPQSTVIVSTDSDLTQIPFMLVSAKVYHPRDMKELEVAKLHPAVQKALVGDDTDTIDGYRGIGPKKSAVLLESHHNLREFLGIVGERTFLLNLLLIDLSLCPQLIINQLYIRRKLAEPVNFDKQQIMDLAQKHKIQGLSTQYHDVVTPFQSLQ